MVRPLALALAALLVLPGARAYAQAGDDDVFVTCVAEGEERGNIEICTKLINSGRLSGKKLATAYNNRGVNYAGLEQYKKAIADYDRAIKLDPREPYFYFNRAFAHEQLKQRARAIADYRMVLKLNPKDPDARSALKRLGARP